MENGTSRAPAPTKDDTGTVAVFTKPMLDELGLLLYNVGSYGNFLLRKDHQYGKGI